MHNGDGLNELGELLALVHRATRGAAQATGEHRSSAVWGALSTLRQSPLRLGDLAAASRVAQPTMTKIVEGLEAQGWVRREADPGDARARLVVITEAGDAALDDWRRRLVAALEPQFGGLDADDVAALRRTVALLRERLAAPTSGAAVSGTQIGATDELIPSPAAGTGSPRTT
ncbi:MAG: MarR family transcriptional regulator [Microbacteriaceae bacterium]